MLCYVTFKIVKNKETKRRFEVKALQVSSYAVRDIKKVYHGRKRSDDNKAGYTATSVACGWAGAVFELLKHLARSSEAKDRKNIKKSKMGTDQPTDRRTDKAGYRVA